VLRTLRALATSAGRVASSSATTLIALHHSADRYGATRLA
jgi:hypothetical protein